MPQGLEFSVADGEAAASDFAWSPDGRRVAVLSRLLRKVTVFDSVSGIRLAGIDDLTGGVASVAFDAHGNVVIPPKGSPGPGAMLWDAQRGRILLLASPGGDPGDTATNMLLSFSVDRASNRLVGVHQVVSGQGTRLRLATYDLADGRLLFVGGPVASDPSLAPGGQRVAVIGQDGQPAIIDPMTGATIMHIEANRNPVRVLAWSPDGRRLATGTIAQSFGLDRATGQREQLRDSALLQLWDVTSGQRLGASTTIDSGITSIDFSPDGRWLAASDSLGASYVYDAATLAGEHRVAREANPQTVILRFSPDGSRLARLRTAGSMLAIDDMIAAVH